MSVSNKQVVELRTPSPRQPETLKSLQHRHRNPLRWRQCPLLIHPMTAHLMTLLCPTGPRPLARKAPQVEGLVAARPPHCCAQFSIASIFLGPLWATPPQSTLSGAATATLKDWFIRLLPFLFFSNSRPCSLAEPNRLPSGRVALLAYAFSRFGLFNQSCCERSHRTFKNRTQNMDNKMRAAASCSSSARVELVVPAATQRFQRPEWRSILGPMTPKATSSRPFFASSAKRSRVSLRCKSWTWHRLMWWSWSWLDPLVERIWLDAWWGWTSRTSISKRNAQRSRKSWNQRLSIFLFYGTAICHDKEFAYTVPTFSWRFLSSLIWEKSFVVWMI